MSSNKDNKIKMKSKGVATVHSKILVWEASVQYQALNYAVILDTIPCDFNTGNC